MAQTCMHIIHVMLAVQGRDANRMLQRIIKAEEKKKRLPKQLAKLHQLLEEWACPTSHGKPFVIGTVAYKAEVLDVIEAELHVMSEFKARKVCIRHTHHFQTLMRSLIKQGIRMCLICGACMICCRLPYHTNDIPRATTESIP
jgi:hypothetical protein